MALEPSVVAEEGRSQQQLEWGEHKGLEASMRAQVGEEGIHTDAGRGNVAVRAHVGCRRHPRGSGGGA